MRGWRSERGEGIKRLLSLFIPLAFMLMTSSLYLFVEKLFLVRVSPQAMQAAVNAAYVCQIFQTSAIALVMMAQVFVANWSGAQKYKAIGPGVWQYIWFSLLSSCLTIPLSIYAGRQYFQGTEIEQAVRSYFYLLLTMNLFYPLGAALSCYFSGRGKTRLILLTTIGMQLLKIALSYLLIFGAFSLPRLGMVGGALSTVISHLGFCAILFLVFLSAKHREQFDTHRWRFQWRLFKECIHPGFLRALNRFLSFTCWAAIAHLMTIRGGDYALVLSMGGTLFFVLPSLADALCQAQTTVVSQLLGAKKLAELSVASTSGYIVAAGISLLFIVPFLLFPSQTSHLLFPTVMLDEQMIRNIFWGIFSSFALFLIGYVPISFVLACKDMKFSLFMGAFNWVNGYLLMVLFLEVMQISADKFWLALSVMHASIVLFYYIRVRFLTQSLQKQLQFAS